MSGRVSTTKTLHPLALTIIKTMTLTILPMHSMHSSPTSSSSSQSTPLRHPSHRSPRQKTPSPSFMDRWRDRMRSDLVARVKSAREQSAVNARGGEDEVILPQLLFCLVIFGANSDYEGYFQGRGEETTSTDGKRGKCHPS